MTQWRRQACKEACLLGGVLVQERGREGKEQLLLHGLVLLQLVLQHGPNQPDPAGPDLLSWWWLKRRKV